MLVLIGLLVLFALATAVLLWAGTAVAQGYFYQDPVGGVAWRAPAVAGILTVIVAVWSLLNFVDAGAPPDPNYNALFVIKTHEHYPPQPLPYFYSVKKGEETKFMRVGEGQRGAVEYRDQDSLQPRAWSKESDGVVEAVRIEEGGKKVEYKARLTKEGKFATSPAEYVGPGGRVLTEENLRRGQKSEFRGWGILLLNLFLNLLHLAAWFLGLWLVLRFQWTHALALAVPIWLALTLFIVPRFNEQAQYAGLQRQGKATHKTA